MDLEQLQRALGMTLSKKEQVDAKIEQISQQLVSQSGRIPPQLLDEMNELEVQQKHLTDHAASLRQQLSKRGFTSSEINAVPKPSTPPPASAFDFPTAPRQSPSPYDSQKKLLETIEHERYHQKHIEEVEQWNKQETARQQQIREQNLKLLQMQEQLQQMKIVEEKKIAEQRQEVEKEQESLRRREHDLNEQQRVQVQEIDKKLSDLRMERTRLAEQHEGLSHGQQQQMNHLQEQRNAILEHAAPAMGSGSSFPPAPRAAPSPYGSGLPNSPPAQAGYGSGYSPAPAYGSQHARAPPPSSPAAYGSQASQHGYPSQAPPSYHPHMGSNEPASEIDLWKQEQDALQNFQQYSSDLQREHQQRLQQEEQDYMQQLKQREEAMRSQWTAEMNQQSIDRERERYELHRQLTDEMLCRMSEADLRMWMDNQNKMQYMEEMSARRQRLLDEQSWIMQQDLANKQMALSFREDDLNNLEWRIQQEKDANQRALARVFCIIIETTNPEGKRTGKTYQLEVRAGDTLYRICERIPHDKDLFCVRLEYEGRLLEDLDENLLNLRIPDNAFMISRLLPKADIDVLNLIPCEDCGKRFDAEVFAAHKCMKNYSQELPSDRRRSRAAASSAAASRQPARTTTSTTTRSVVRRPTVQRTEVIPCEYCDGLFPVDRYSAHTRTCSSRSRDPVPRVTRYHYY